MAVAEGVIEVVSSKEIPEDQYGNTFRRSFKLEGNDQWFGVGAGKKGDISIKVGTDWHKLSKGDVVEFMYEQNGAYANVKTTKITVKKSGGGSNSSTPVAKAPASPGRSGSFDSGIKTGHALNNAVQLAIAQGKTDMGTIEKLASEILNLSRKIEQNFESYFTDEKKEVKLPPEPKAKKEVKTLADVDFDDDIPF